MARLRRYLSLIDAGAAFRSQAGIRPRYRAPCAAGGHIELEVDDAGTAEDCRDTRFGYFGYAAYPRLVPTDGFSATGSCQADYRHRCSLGYANCGFERRGRHCQGLGQRHLAASPDY